MPQARPPKPVRLRNESIAPECAQFKGELHGQTSSYLPTPPDSQSPRTFVIAEATAIRCLVKLYAWTWLEAGVLRRPGA